MGVNNVIKIYVKILNVMQIFKIDEQTSMAIKNFCKSLFLIIRMMICKN